ncbi:MAG TPA: hypothetical protein VFJ95_16375, partial [Gammaproteobacteria bacterium]|nr:hypothetical protein [Gammaproteobacteria bacterium]
PPELERGADETLATWRDRLYQQFRIPALLAGLTDLKAAYVEVANPLLARSVLDCVRELPDRLRTDKRLWREIVRSALPDVPFASCVAVMTLEDFVTDGPMLALMHDELSSKTAGDLFPPALRARICGAVEAALLASGGPRRRPSLKHRFTRAIPEGLRVAARSWLNATPGLNPLVLAFRSFVASRMNTLLKVDAATPPADLQRAVNL